VDSVAKESTRVLTAKLSLDRELATLRPELDHLKSQATLQHTIISENLALQRQINTLEGELKMEKRAAQRAARKNVEAEKIADYQSQLDELIKDQARERKEAARIRNETESELKSQLEAVQQELAQEKQKSAKLNKKHSEDVKQSTHIEHKMKEALEKAKIADRLEEEAVEFQARYEALESELQQMRADNKTTKELEKQIKASETRCAGFENKLETLRIKLRDTKDQLKERQEELNQLREQLRKAEKQATNTRPPTQKSRKRPVPETVADNVIGTPDGAAPRGKRPAANRGRADLSLVGDKSMFSVTPFLNRTVNMALESPETPQRSENNQKENLAKRTLKAAGVEVLGTRLASDMKNGPPVQTNTDLTDPTRNEPDVLTEAKSLSKNRKPARARTRPTNLLENVTEEGDENEKDEIHIAEDNLNPELKKEKKKRANQRHLLEDQKVISEAGPKVKKRKLLGGTLFDDEDGESTKRPVKGSAVGGKSLNKGPLLDHVGKMKSKLGANSAFGGFSPLKKDRRGMGASFLA
jgi:myosin heavy subunit